MLVERYTRRKRQFEANRAPSAPKAVSADRLRSPFGAKSSKDTVLSKQSLTPWRDEEQKVVDDTLVRSSHGCSARH